VVPRRVAIKSKELLAYFEKRELLRAGHRVGLAVSGGADSVALLRLLLELRDELGVVLSVVHFNHKLRGRESDSDEIFVAKLAEKFGLTLHIGRGDVARKAKAEKANVEDAARRARYDFFRKLTEGGLVDCVATAHTADDQAETVLAHILRGTGLAGLGGIHSATKDAIVRPLLTVRREELRKYLRAKRQTWREDATNRDTTKQRARMRKKLLPLLEKEFNPKAVEHLCALAHLAQNDEAYLSSSAQLRCEVSSKFNGGIHRFPILDLVSSSSEALASRMIRILVNDVRKDAGELRALHVEAVRELARSGENGKVLQLPGGVDVRRDNNMLVFLPREKSGGKRESTKEYSYKFELGGGEKAIAVKEIGCVIRLRSIDWPSEGRDTSKRGCVVLDEAKLNSTLVLRSLRPGDRMRPEGRQHAHKLSRLLNERRISRWERAGWPVLESARNIVWARGFVAAEFAPTHGTQRAILVSEEPA
jgi:tRNA(Ile)-lysidine synthase